MRDHSSSKSTSIKWATGVFVLVCLSLIALAACSNKTNSTSDVKESTTEDHMVVRVNGDEVKQSEIDQQIDRIMSGTGYSEDTEGWSAYLASNDMSEDVLRRQIIENTIADLLIAQEAERLGITVDDAYIDQLIQSQSSHYPDASSWQQALSANGFDDASYRQALRMSLLRNALAQKVVTEVEPTTEQIESYALTVAPTLAGKRSSHILFSRNDENKAWEVVAQLRGGADFAEMAQAYSMDSSGANGGDVGWDSLSSFVPEYQDALNKLGEGEISDPVLSQFGYHIIKCTDVFELDPNAQSVDLNSIPPNLMDRIIVMMKSDMREISFKQYLLDLERKAVIEVPENSPFTAEELISDAESTLQSEESTVAAAGVGTTGAAGAAGE